MLNPLVVSLPRKHATFVNEMSRPLQVYWQMLARRCFLLLDYQITCHNAASTSQNFAATPDTNLLLTRPNAISSADARNEKLSCVDFVV